MKLEQTQEKPKSPLEQLTECAKALPSILSDLLGKQHFSAHKNRDFSFGELHPQCSIRLEREGKNPPTLHLRILHKNPKTRKSEEIGIEITENQVWISLEHHIFPLEIAVRQISEDEEHLINLLAEITETLKTTRNREQNAQAANIATNIGAQRTSTRTDAIAAIRPSTEYAKFFPAE